MITVVIFQEQTPKEPHTITLGVAWNPAPDGGRMFCIPAPGFTSLCDCLRPAGRVVLPYHITDTAHTMARIFFIVVLCALLSALPGLPLLCREGWLRHLPVQLPFLTTLSAGADCLHPVSYIKGFARRKAAPGTHRVPKPFMHKGFAMCKHL